MGLIPKIGSFYLLFLLVCIAEAADFNVIEHGGVGDGIIDNTQAFMDTWKLACASEGPTSFIVPKGSFRVGQVTFLGPCKSYMNFVIQGNIMAEPDPAKFITDSWIVFQSINGMQLSGGGTFDGQGSVAWTKKDCRRDGPACKYFPCNLRFNYIENAMVTNITSLNSKQFHLNMMTCKNITFLSVNIQAPENSPNTDGIHMGLSTDGVNITNSVISTGDDCISIGPGSRNVYVYGVTCGPGHGISIGSLGKYPNEQDVTGITVKNCTITAGAYNGVRIKTWPKSPVSAATNFTFEDIIMDNVMNPIIIDQAYCPFIQCTQKDPSKVKISDVTFNNIRGTSMTKNAVTIICSQGIPCENVRIGNVNLKYTGIDGPAASVVQFAKPILTGVQDPPITISSS